MLLKKPSYPTYLSVHTLAHDTTTGIELRTFRSWKAQIEEEIRKKKCERNYEMFMLATNMNERREKMILVPKIRILD